MFKNNINNWFKFKSRFSSCAKLSAEGKTISDPSDICAVFRDYFSSLSTSRSNPEQSNEVIHSLLLNSFNNNDTILHDKFTIEEISTAIRKLKSGKAAGPDNLTAEHLKHGGLTIQKWLLKIFNRILSLEEIPPCLKQGIITPAYKRKGKDPLLVDSYRGIIISSVLSKLLETIIMRIDVFLEDLNIPHCLQTAYRKGLSCSDAVFATQEALLTHLREGRHPYICLFDVEKAFDSIELSTLLSRLSAIGINGKCWRILFSWYSSVSSIIRINSSLSDPFLIARGVKQGSVPSPILFLTVLDSLLLTLKEKNARLSILGSFVGAATHADDLRTIAPSTTTIAEQANIIDAFTKEYHLSINTQKTEIVKISLCRPDPEDIHLRLHCLHHSTRQISRGLVEPQPLCPTISSRKCYLLFFIKARKAFFAFGRIEAFQGHLNPLSANSIYESCVIPLLLYGSDTWLLDSTTIHLLDRFQNEIGRRIVKLQKNTSGKVVHLCLSLQSMTCRILLKKPGLPQTHNQLSHLHYI